MADIIYKTLFSARLLHEYYLVNNDGSSLFDDNTDPSDFLLGSFNKGIASISDNFLYEVPSAFRNTFENYYLHIIPNYSGFSVLTRVLRQKLPDGTITYKPFVKLPDNVNIPIQLSVRTALINTITDIRINRAIPAIYYFTNEDIITPRTFPALTASIPAFDPAYSYEQGELYVNDENKVCLFYMDDNNQSFLPVIGSNYANARDELIVPLQFTYTFTEADIVTNANFELSNSTGKTVRSYVFSYSNPVRAVTINFSFNQVTNPDLPADTILTLPEGSAATEENIYTLTVTVNNTKTLVYKLMFFEAENVEAPCWAIVNIKPVVANPDFSIYDEDGFIKYRTNADGSQTPAPVFEIRIKSRNTFWRYTNDKNGKLKVNDNDPFLKQSGNNLVTKIPRPASYLPTLFKNTTDNSTHYLPNPESTERVRVTGNTIYTDIRVPESKMFPLDTS